MTRYLQLLDAGEVAEDVGREGKSRRKPLPATYEPGEARRALGALCRSARSHGVHQINARRLG